MVTWAVYLVSPRIAGVHRIHLTKIYRYVIIEAQWDVPSLKEISMIGFLNKNKYWIIIILLSLIVRLIPFVCVARHPERAFGEDSYLYHHIAVDLVKHQSFSDASQTPEKGARFQGLTFKLSAFHDKKLSRLPDSLRTPLYPFYLATIYTIFGYKPYLAILFQILIDVFTCIFTYKIGTILFSRKIGFVAAILVAIDLSSIVYSNCLGTETLFTFTLITSVWFLVKFFLTTRKVNLVFAGIFLGLTTLCRPISLYLFLPIILVFFLKYKLNLKKLSLMYSIFIIVFLLTTSTWILRNYLVFGVPKLSSLMGYQMLLYRYGPMEAEKKGVDFKIIKQKLTNEIQEMITRENLAPFEASQRCEKLGMQKILNDPVPYLQAHLKGTIKIFLGHSLEDIYLLFGGKYYSSSALSIFLETKDMGKSVSALFKTDLLNISLLLSILILLLLIYLFAGYGVWKMIKDNNKVILVLFIVVIAYFILITGPVGYARFRLPIIPYLMLLTSYGFCGFIGSLRQCPGTGNKLPREEK
ncbi:MAG: glycosyltransferase family 39 protein [bacterium]